MTRSLRWGLALAVAVLVHALPLIALFRWSRTGVVAAAAGPPRAAKPFTRVGLHSAGHAPAPTAPAVARPRTSVVARAGGDGPRVADAGSESELPAVGAATDGEPGESEPGEGVGSGEPSEGVGSQGLPPSPAVIEPDLNDVIHASLAAAASGCYPAAARRFREIGTVVIRFCVDASGAPNAVEVANTSGAPVLDGAAKTCVVARAAPFPTRAAGRCFDVPVRFGVP